VAFESDATNLVLGDTNGAADIFVRDLPIGRTTRVSVDSLGRQANGASFNAAISADGRFVAFESDATNLVLGDTTGKRDVFFHDLR
jgi:Tol biopolymer transport system component